MNGKKIIVAGAGHGGLAAAALLAERGFNVEVYEKEKREDLGYDWHDTIANDTFDIIGVSYKKEDIEIRKDTTFYSPSLKTPVSFDVAPENVEWEIDRKVLYGYLLKNAGEKGVKLFFSKNISAPYIENGEVAGIVADGEVIKGDMVIDSAGLRSPVISNLPESYGIKPDYGKNDIFRTYRAYYNLVEGEKIINGKRFNIYMKPCGLKGIAWFKITEGTADIIIGSVDNLYPETVERILKFLRTVQPAIGYDLIRGGGHNEIPLKSAFSLMVGNRYAAIGDAVSMPIPLNGSGITNSIRAGVILAETIEKAKDFKIENLWYYQTGYFKTVGAAMLSIAVLKNMLLDFKDTTLDFFFDKEILTGKEMGAGANGQEVVIGPAETLDKLKKGYKKLGSLIALKAAVKKSKAAKLHALAIPERYEQKAVSDWRKKLDKFLN